METDIVKIQTGGEVKAYGSTSTVRNVNMEIDIVVRYVKSYGWLGIIIENDKEVFRSSFKGSSFDAFVIANNRYIDNMKVQL